MPKTYNISLSIRDVGKTRRRVFVISHAGLPEGNRSSLAISYSALLSLLDFIKVRPAELQRIRDELWIHAETSIHDVQVGPTEFPDIVWGQYFQLLHECSKSAALREAAKRATEAKRKYANQSQ